MLSIKSLSMQRIICIALAASRCQAFLPSVAPQNYGLGDPVELVVNTITSPSSAVPYDYYDDRLHFCKPENGSISQPESLGSVLYGDRLYNSPFQLNMLKNNTCNVLCAPVTVPTVDVKFLSDRIKESSVMKWFVDNLPVAQPLREIDGDRIFYSIGFDLGGKGKTDEKGNTLVYLHNHFRIQILYNADSSNKDRPYRVTGALIWPSSRHYSNIHKKIDCNDFTGELFLKDTEESQIIYTYDIIWQESNIAWNARWDNYLRIPDANVHWFSIVNAIVIILVLSGMVGAVTIQSLNRDITRYNAADTQEEAQEDSGWKLIHGDVFRTPPKPMLLSVLVGTGAQLLIMTLTTLIFAMLGILNPANRGSLMTAMIVLWACLGSVAGYISARMYKMFGGESWKKNVFMTAFLCPGIVFGIFLVLNFFLIDQRSSGAVPSSTVFSLITIWFLLSAPLSFIGSYRGFKQPRIDHSVRTNQIPRQIPMQAVYFRPLTAILIGGVLPFGAMLVELYFIMNSIWFHRIYLVFGFLFVVYGILILVCAQVTVLMTYFQLCAEDYRWWWRSFLTSGASAFYVFLYCVYYVFSRLQMTSFVSMLLYFGWSLTMCLILGVLTGSVGFAAAWLFVRKMYKSIKID